MALLPHLKARDYTTHIHPGSHGEEYRRRSRRPPPSGHEGGAVRIVTLEEAFSFPPVRLANHGHPTEGMYDLLVRAGYWPAGDSFPPGINDIGNGRLADMDAAGVDYQV